MSDKCPGILKWLFYYKTTNLLTGKYIFSVVQEVKLDLRRPFVDVSRSLCLSVSLSLSLSLSLSHTHTHTHT